MRGISPYEWKARALNQIFDEAGGGENGGSITASTVADGELKRRWAERWPEKAFGRLDDESRQWAQMMLNRAGTRIVLVKGKPMLV